MDTVRHMTEQTQAEPRPPEENTSKIEFWLRWIPGAKKAAEPSWACAKDAWCEYEKGELEQGAARVNGRISPDTFRCFPIYWSSCETMYPAFYSKDPELTARRRFDIEDGVALTASLIAERLSEYLVENSPFSQTMRACVGDFLHAAKTTTQIITKTKQQTQRVGLQESNGKYLREGGDPYQDEVLQDEQGYFGQATVDVVDAISIAPVVYDEVLHTPEAKSQDEITEMAYYFRMDYDEAKARFPKCPEHCFKNTKSYERAKDEEDRGDIPGRYLEGYECYCLKTKMSYWVCLAYKDDFLDKKPDPYGFRGFFPSPKFAIQNKPSKSMYPTPAYSHLEPALLKLHEVYRRKFDLIDAIERIILVDGAEPELVDALNNARAGRYVGMKNLQSILDKGGLQNCIFVVELKELVAAIAECTSLEEEFSNRIYEWFGVPDILRGVSDPQEALGTQEIKQSAAHDRFKNQKKQIQELARDSIEMMLDLALQVFPAERIAQIVGLEFMGQDHQQRFVPALELLKSDDTRLIRIDIETDSTSFQDSQAQLAKSKMISEVIVNGLATIGGMQHREFMPPVLKAFLGVIESMDASKQFQDSVLGAVKDLQKAAEQPPPQEPDHEAMKIKVMEQGVQLKAHKQELDAAAKQRELDQKEYKILSDERDKAFRSELEALKAGFQKQLQSAYLNLDTQKVVIDAHEELLEEDRLALEAEAQMVEAASPEEPKAPKAPAQPVTININGKGDGA